jgi:hypothetical protein
LRKRENEKEIERQREKRGREGVVQREREKRKTHRGDRTVAPVQGKPFISHKVIRVYLITSSAAVPLHWN